MNAMKPLLIRASKVMLRLAMDRALVTALPKVYERLDADLPQVLSVNPAPIVVESVVAQAIAAATKRRATEAQIAAVVGLYDPIAAALRNFKR